MTANLTQIASQIIANLRVTDPELDTSVGTPTRKIIDAVSESIAEGYVDQHLLTYQYDIDAKVDADLDDFVQMFGLARLAARRASGTVTFTRQSASADATTVFIPVNTQIRSNTTPAIVVQTVTGAYMEPGALSVTVPVQAVEGGPSGNVAAGSLVSIASPISGVNVVSNISPLSGGTAQETDDQLRERWKKTVFRSLAGTEQMYLGVAIDDADCYAANVIGGSKKRREQVQISGGMGQTTVDDAAYVYAEPVLVGENIDAGDLVLKDVDYTWNTSVNPPRIQVLDADTLPDGNLFEVDFEYMPKASRNAPDQGIVNRVDIWVGGQRAQSAVQSVVFKQANRFTDTSTDVLYRQNFIRANGQVPLSGNIFVPLAFGPVLTVPSTISVGGSVYALASSAKPMDTQETINGVTVTYAYQIVHDNTAFGYAATSSFGLEWSQYSMPANLAVFSVGGAGQSDYTYNALIASVQAAVDRWRLLGVDARVHQAKSVALRMSLAIMYAPQANQSVVNTAIDQAISNLLTGVGFQGRVQVSDVLQAVHNVPGVDNVRFLHGSDYSGYDSANPNNYNVGIQKVVDGTVATSYVDSTGRPLDLRFGDDELPIFHSTVVMLKAQNTFGAA